MKVLKYPPVLFQDLRPELQKSIRKAHFQNDKHLQKAYEAEKFIIVGYFLDHPITEDIEDVEDITIDA